jgi:hypothetical protein
LFHITLEDPNNVCTIKPKFLCLLCIDFTHVDDLLVENNEKKPKWIKEQHQFEMIDLKITIKYLQFELAQGVEGTFPSLDNIQLTFVAME